MKLFMILRIFLTVVILSSSLVGIGDNAAYASGNNYYVSTTGLDSNPGTEVAPWRTIQKAAQTMVAGDTVYVRGGVYNSGIIAPRNSGEAGRPITFRTYPGELPVIDGAGFDHSSIAGLFTFHKNSYLILDGFEIRNALGTRLVYGIYNDGQYNILKNLKIHRTNGGGIHAYGSNLLIEDCEIWDSCFNGINEALSIVNVNGFEVRNCKIYGSTKNGLQVKNGSRNGLIHGNEIYGHATTGLYLDAHGTDIY
ncbi:MAG TPA: right-handed parallel beta-helix repeat-containing protein, partial [Dehalococcoidales bacterium]|nr:right-handed parallel beta-helix repeat-containing protein [Dehalococcoidales bacterium]